MAIGTKVLTFGGSKVGTVGENKLMGWDIYFQAKNFISVANITDPTQITAINYLVKELVDNNLIGKFNFIYPMVGGDATKHSYNLIDTGLYRLTFNGGWTHSANGATPNGANAWGNTNCNAQILGNTNNVHLSYYSRTDTAPGYAISMGVNIGGLPTLALRIKEAIDGRAYAFFANSVTNQPFFNSVTGTTLFMANTTSPTSRQLIRNGIVLNQNTVNEVYSAPNGNIYIGAYNLNGTAAAFDNKQCAFASGGQRLTSGEITIFNNIVQQYQTKLGRNV